MVSTPSPPHFVNPVHLVQSFVHLFRLPVGILAALAGCASIYVLDATAPLKLYLLTALILVSMTSAACAINDYWDIGKDRIDHPERPLPSGQLSLAQAWWAAVTLFGCALIAALAAGVSPCILEEWQTVSPLVARNRKKAWVATRFEVLRTRKIARTSESAWSKEERSLRLISSHRRSECSGSATTVGGYRCQ